MKEKDILQNNIPNHVAIILDGNGRWAKKRLMPRTYGHLHGANNLVKITKYANEIGIKCLTVFCFSTENWSRPEKEVEYLMKKPLSYYRKYKNKIFDTNLRISFIGRRDRISTEMLKDIEEAEELTKDHTGLHLVVAIDYGSLDDIKTATIKMNQDIINNKLDIKDINDNTIYDYLSTSNLPKLDLLIRTSGEIRISNFLLLELAYAELYFTETLWPDFNENELLKAIESYQKRNRRFGGLKEEKQ